MTRDRARKHAARQRAAVTGERYVVARRVTAEPASTEIGRLDALTHKVPGVPPHVDGGLQAATPRGRTANPRQRDRTRNHEPRVHGEPRILVAWQNWIARRVGTGSR